MSSTSESRRSRRVDPPRCLHAQPHYRRVPGAGPQQPRGHSFRDKGLRRGREGIRGGTGPGPAAAGRPLQLGNDLLRQDAFRSAVRRFSKSLRLYPTDVWALNNRGLAYMKLGKRERARLDFEGALRIDPGFEQARRNLEGMKSRQ